MKLISSSLFLFGFLVSTSISGDEPLPSESEVHSHGNISEAAKSTSELLFTSLSIPTTTIYFGAVDTTSHTSSSSKDVETTNFHLILRRNGESTLISPKSSDSPTTNPPSGEKTPKSGKPKLANTPTKTRKAKVLTTSIKRLKKIVHVSIDADTLENHPVKPTSQPTFAEYDQGVVYIAGVPHQVLDAQASYDEVQEGDNPGEWIKIDDTSEILRNLSVGDAASEGQSGDGVGMAGEGKAVYSADMTSAAENAVKKAAFFSLAAAGMTTVALLVYFRIIGG